MLPIASLQSRVQAAVRAVLPDADPGRVLIRPCPEPRFGDYQCNALMALARERKLNPRELAARVQAALDVAGLCAAVELAGPGFLNFRLHPDALTATLTAAARGDHLFFEPAAAPRTVVVDFSSPNVAKPMHVGHIRSTILGDALARTLRRLGHGVITDNHLGDWGTQFGMLLVGWKTALNRDALRAAPIAELARLYREVHARCQTDPETLEAARRELVKLQQGDSENLAIWREMIAVSRAEFDVIYRRLGVQFDYTYGESFYNSRLPGLVAELVAAGIARDSEGAKAVFSDGQLPPEQDPFLVFRDGQWQPNPLLIQKSDGGFNYATTDLATLQFRLETWQPDEIIYVTDGRQQLHFRQVFAAFRRWKPEAARIKLAHVWFGSILGEDGKPFKTRSGETIKLADLLDEAEERAFRIVTEKNPDLPEDRRRAIARAVGIGAVKYADLLPNRQSDYVFSWDKMLALQGNTAPYLQYACARIRSLFRKGDMTEEEIRASETELRFTAPEEIALAKHLLNFGLTLEAVAEEYRPNYLCNYLYALAGRFTAFYESCPVLRAEEGTRRARLALCQLTGRVLATGLGTLGIEAPEQM